jgi:hypothetical protein
VGVHPFVTLFCNYYNMRLDSSGTMTIGFTLRLHDGWGWDYIDMSQKKWDPWRADWCWVRLSEDDPLLVDPSALLACKSEWQETDPRDSELAPVVESASEATQRRHHGPPCVHHLPLGKWRHSNTTTIRCGRLRASETPPGSEKGHLEEAEQDRHVNQILGGTQGAARLSDSLQSLCEHNGVARSQILGKMPACNARGPSVAGQGQPEPTTPLRRRQLVLQPDSEEEA